MKVKKIIKKYKLQTIGEFKTLELTDEQYRRLLLLIHLGMSTIDSDGEELDIAMTDIEQYVQSFSNTFKANDLVTYDETNDFYFPSDELSANTNKIIEKYELDSFRFELVQRMSKRDIKILERTEGKKNANEIEEIELKYLDEFLKNDVENLHLIK